MPPPDGKSPIEPLLRNEDMPRILACSDRTVLRLRSAGRFPKPDLFIGNGSRKSPRWRIATIEAWIASGGAR